jgi:HEAT repeat protein
MFSPTPLPRNLEASFRDLASERAATRASAIRDVVRHASRSDAARARAIPILEGLLRDDPSATVRAQAAVGLADVCAGVSTLLFAVEDDDAHVRQMALSALGEIGDTRAIGRLERALSDERPEVRYQAVIAFARVARNDPGAVALALQRALDDRDGAIRYVAMRVIEEHAIDEKALRDATLTSRAEQLMDGPDEAVAVVAALYLARLEHPAARQVVLAVVTGQRSTPEREDEEACIELVGELKLREGTAALERRVWGTQGRLRAILAGGGAGHATSAWHARIALARMGHERAKAEILVDLSSWRRQTREAAVVAAGLARMGEARSTLEQLGGVVDAALVREALVRLAVD